MAWFTQGSEEYGEYGEMLLHFFLDDEENDDRVVVRISELVRCLKHFRESVLSNDEHDYEYEMAGHLWAAPLEGGTLTAEQVRKAVKGHGNIMDNRLYEDWEAVADELNAKLGSEVANADDALSLLDEIREAGRISYDDYSQLFDAIAELGSGTCNPIETETLENVTAHVMECDRCGKVYEHVNGAYEHCPRCGRRVER